MDFITRFGVESIVEIFRPLRRTPIWVALVASLVSVRAGAQQTSCNAAQFLAASSWSGTVTITGSGSGTTRDSYGNVHTYSVSQSIQLSPSLTPSSKTPMNSLGPENASVSINDQYTVTPPGSPTATYIYSANGSTAMGAEGLGATLTFDNIPEACGYTFGADESFSPATITVNGAAQSTNTLSWGTTNVPNLLQPPSTPTAPQGFVSFPSSGTTLTGSVTFTGLPWDLPSFFSPTENPVVTWTISWNLKPASRPLDLIVTIPNYATWQPTAGPNEISLALDSNEQPNLLAINATLVYKDTQQPTPFGPDNVTFALAGVSHEPGVSMNWPPPAKLVTPTPPDLTFTDLSDTLPINQKFTFNSDGTQATYTPPSGGNGNSIPTIYMLSWDWGGWATLNVTAKVAGQTLTGHFQGSTNTNIPLPQSQPGSHIADTWKNANNVSLSTPDDDDSEPNPVSRADCLGDGFTLYEEYRGFMENGNHIQGDPNSKDFFIENRIGADAEPGIWLFTQLTGLTVHKDIQRNEALIDHPNGAAGSILMNFNHSNGAAYHATDQHGVMILTTLHYPGTQAGMDGGLTVVTVAGVRPQPAIVDGIAIQDRDRPGTFNPANTHSGMISPTEAFLQYDIGVAHELIHSVGGEHHGDTDLRQVLFMFYAPNTPKNPSGQPIITLNGQTVHLLQESNGADLATAIWQKGQSLSTFCKVVSATSFVWPNFIVTVCNNLLSDSGSIPIGLYVGEPHAEHSGDMQCVMRYFFANAYPSATAANTYYIVPSGTEAAGSTLCTSPAGTGVNDPSHQPQPRYFDAAPGRGSCNSWICVSDAYAPVPVSN
ncbi:MAG: hypothetical protein ABSH39_03050 [Candidatus Acidiferrum sp.]